MIGKKSGLERVVPWLALVVSLVSAVFTGLSYWNSQENLVVIVRRDARAPVGKLPSAAAIVGLEDIVGVQARWLVQVTNSSTTATLSVTGVEAIARQFSGSSTDARQPPWMGSAGTFLRVDDHKPVVLPLRLLAGETVELEVLPVFNVKAGTADRFAAGPIEVRPGVFRRLAFDVSPEGWGHDLFGNFISGPNHETVSLLTATVIKQPRLEVKISTARGHDYFTSGD